MVNGVGGRVPDAPFRLLRITALGRSCSSDVFEVSEGVPPLLGQIPLEAMDFVVDPRGQKLVGNPDHVGEHLMECY